MWTLHSLLAPKHRINRPRSRGFRPRVEALEDRCCPSGGTMEWSDPHALTNSNGYGGAPVIQPDAKILVPGLLTATSRSGSTSYYLGLARHNADGSLDSSFGNAGEVIGPVADNGANVQAALYPMAGTVNDGKIVVTGLAGGFSIARFNANGSLDTTFGSKGIATANLSKTKSSAESVSVVIQPDGKIVALGETFAASSKLARFNANGSLDTTFGTAGLATAQPSDVAEVLLQPDGKLIVVGQQSWVNASGMDMARYNANGTLDTSFGNAGVVTNNAFGFAYGGAIYGVAGTVNDGKIVVAGDTPQPSTNVGVELARYNPNGTLDTSFGSAGVVTTQISPNTDWAKGVAIQTDGKIVAAGTAGVGGGNPTVPTFALMRYNTDGGLDGTFGAGGIVTTLIGVKSELFTNAGGVALQANGDIVLAGASYNGSKWEIALADYLPSDPEIGSFMASPNPVSSGSSTTLTASNITDANHNSTITQVAFYVVVNGSEMLLGYGTQMGSGVWTYSFNTAGYAPGTYTLYAQATDSYGVLGDAVALALTIQ